MSTTWRWSFWCWRTGSSRDCHVVGVIWPTSSRGPRCRSCCQIPLLAQRSNRLNTVFQGPKSLGRSRHGAPVRLHHSTASTKLRSSRPGRPARFLMPSAALILCHCRSSNCKRTIVDTPWSTPAAQWKARSSEWLTKVGSPCAPSWARRARARPAPPTSAYPTNGPNDSSRTVGHGHGHVYGHARAIPIQGHALALLAEPAARRLAPSIVDVLVDHSHCLHVSIDDGRAHEGEAALLQVLAQRIRNRGTRGHLLQAGVAIL